jgi:hypothetical protein
MNKIHMKRRACRLRDRFVAAVVVLAVPSIALADDAPIPVTVLDQPPSAVESVEMRVILSVPNEPTPIIVDFAIGPNPESIQGVTLPEAPEAAGTVVNVGSALVVTAVSPAVAVSDSTDGFAAPNSAPVETTATVTLDPAASNADLGKSGNPLVAATEAIFPAQSLSSALFAPPASGTFFALALQNPDAADSTVSIELWDQGAVVASASVALPSRSKVSRDVSELFPSVTPGAGSFFQLTATVPVQMLGLNGDETDGSVAPVLPALASP